MFTLIRPLFPYFRRYRRDFFWGGLSIILSNAIAVLFPLVVALVIDGLNTGVTRRKILIYSGMLLGVTVGKGIFLFLSRLILIGISRDIEFDLRNDLFAQLEKQPASYYHRNRTGDIMARMTNDLNAVRMLIGPAIMYSANTILFSVGALFFLMRISPFLTLVALVPLPLASILVQALGRKIHDRFERIQAMFSDISAHAQENFSGARLIRAFAQEEAQIASFDKANREYIRRGLKLVQLMGMLWPTLEFVLGLALAITLLVGGHEVLTHRITVGNFVAFNTYMMMMTWPIIAVGWVVNLFQRGTASVIRINELLTEEPTIDDRDADPGIPPTSSSAERSNSATSPSPTQAKRQCHSTFFTTSRSKSPPEEASPSSAPPAQASPRWSASFRAFTMRQKEQSSSTAAHSAPIASKPSAATSASSLRKHSSSAKPCAKTSPSAFPLPLTKRSSAPPRPHTSAPSSTNSPKAFRPWSANAASLSPADRSSAQR